MTPHPHPTPARRRTGLLVGALVVALALGACDLRLESAAPTEPTAGPAEQVRERTVDDALALAAAATSARATADEATAAVLDDVAAFSTAHAGQLGGVYDSGLPEPSGTPTAADAASTVPATPDDVLAALSTDAATALGDAAAADDGALARLLAAVGVARESLATRLAAALNEPVPDATATSAEPTGPTEATEPSTAPTPGSSATPEPSPTSALPAGMTAEDAAALVLAHDQAGFGLEVVAAKLDGDARAATHASAVAHRAAAEAWAQRAGIADTATDPRRAVYALPADVDDPDGARALAASLEAGVADAASAALVHASAGARDELVDALRTATAAAAGWGGAPTAFPGIPDLG